MPNNNMTSIMGNFTMAIMDANSVGLERMGRHLDLVEDNSFSKQAPGLNISAAPTPTGL